ncbi:MAG: DNA topoisomerase IB [Acidobacteriota bacterium]|nr:DNA topoisomerase IB [Acidobacteriota bacterium]
MGCVEPLHQLGEAIGQRFVPQRVIKCPQLHPDGGVSDRFGLRNFSVWRLLVCSFIAAIIFGVILGSHRVEMFSGQKSSVQWYRFLRLTPIAHACLTVVGTSLLERASRTVRSELQINYIFDDEPGLQRRRNGRGFTYVDRCGRRVDSGSRRRIERLVIPPAWKEVWISPDPNGHIQATGRDAKGRKQYIYHPGWRSWREETKFLRVLDFAGALPKLRERVARDLADRNLSQALVLATAVRVLDRTLMRVGNDEYAKQNQSYGLTTLLGEHIESAGTRVRFSFRGKHGKFFEAEFSDRRVAAILRRLEGIPGQHLFQFIDESGEPRRITSDDVNAYIREATQGDFTAKDFRTWAATVLAAVEFCQIGPADSDTAGRRNVASAVRSVARRLGNTPAVCRTSYIHPEILSSYADGTLLALAHKLEDPDLEAATGLFESERSVLRFLRRRLKQQEMRPQPTLSPPRLADAVSASLSPQL